ncbi:hypothetical protein BDA96_07G015000 [Sorghum bicolor]|uniref:Knottin scorpion toxin-like domain-containing protein n=2 Tax=Sorghum bicolor TaxID=4558 RepID=A0A921QJV4_SORBI|nr:hypothetical protein BDA96_07G015000 [Sorghum bicolor]KXG24251.1 hypothetical protein SORBI_3007G014300 [Sorghum bicolor]
MAATKNNLLFPFLLLAMVLVASHEGNKMLVGAETCESIADDSCGGHPIFLCLDADKCDDCCRDKGYNRGKCNFLSCDCCK